MTRGQSKHLIVVAAVAAAIAAIVAVYFAYATYQERELTRLIVELATDTSTRLRAAVAIEPDAPGTDNAANQEKLDEHAAAVDKHYDAVHGMHAAPIRPLADAADEYVLGAREIIRRKAASHRYQLEVAASIQALRDHMRADDRTGPWVTTAIRAKEQLEKNYRDYRLATEALIMLFDSYPASRARFAAELASVPLLEDSVVEQARTRAAAALKELAAQAGQVGRLDAHR